MLWTLCDCPAEPLYKRVAVRACACMPVRSCVDVLTARRPHAAAAHPLRQADADAARRDGWTGLSECCYKDTEGRKLIKLVLRDTNGGREMVVVHGGERRAGSRCAHNEASAHPVTPRLIYQGLARAQLELQDCALIPAHPK